MEKDKIINKNLKPNMEDHKTKTLNFETRLTTLETIITKLQTKNTLLETKLKEQANCTRLLQTNLND